jgi:transposase
VGYKIGVDKKQMTLFPVCLDEYVSEDHICRVISAFTEGLDMSALGYKYAECKSTGCRPYDPRMILNLYIYGYLHSVRSSRRLRDEAARNIEVMWLMDGLKPDDKTICNFRKDNTLALRQTFREFAITCRKLGLYGGELVATDSSKFRANNSRKKNYNQIVVKNEITHIDNKIIK